MAAAETGSGRLPQRVTTSAEPLGTGPLAPDADRAVSSRLGNFDVQTLRREFAAQGAFLYLPDFLAPEITQQLVAAVAAVKESVNRNYLPGHKQGGSVSRHAIDRLVPLIADLYRSPALIDWLGRLSGERLQMSPPEDPHAYAMYFYTRPGDHIGWHYDTSYYAGRRYTLLLGVIDESIMPARLRAAYARGRRGRGSRFAADSPGRPGVFRRRQIAPPHHAAVRRVNFECRSPSST